MNKSAIFHRFLFPYSGSLQVPFGSEVNMKNSCYLKTVEEEIFHNQFMIIAEMSSYFFFFSIWVFFHGHSRFTRQQGKGEGISFLTPFYLFHPLHRHIDISQAITAESSPLTRTWNLWFPGASR